MSSEVVNKANYVGEIVIADQIISCAVLDDGTRLLSERSVTKALGGKRGGSHWRRKKMGSDGANLPVYVSANNLQAFIDADLSLALSKPIEYKDSKSGSISFGLEATLLPKVCEVFLKARDAKKLLPSQAHIAEAADLLIRGFAHVGIVALIDEATGYQYDRKYNALRVLLQAYLEDQIRPWTKQFPDKFFEELDKLYGNTRMTPQIRPRYYGNFINKYVYDPLERGLVNAELQRRYIDDGKKHRKHQHLTTFGEGQLRLQIGRILGLMEVAPNLNWFKKKQSRQEQLALFDDIDDE